MKPFPWQIILASKSPRRQYLLKELGLELSIRTKETDESFPANLKAQEIALYLCHKKAMAFESELNEHSLVITADTIVWIKDVVLNKPANEEEAIQMLSMLSGNKHQVFTGVCLLTKHKTKVFYVESNVYFKSLSANEIKAYVQSRQPYDKAGAYGAQECLAPGVNPCSKEEMDFLKKMNKLNLVEKSKANSSEGENYIIEKIEGSYFNVMGLPIKELYEELERFAFP